MRAKQAEANECNENGYSSDTDDSQDERAVCDETPPLDSNAVLCKKYEEACEEAFQYRMRGMLAVLDRPGHRKATRIVSQPIGPLREGPELEKNILQKLDGASTIDIDLHGVLLAEEDPEELHVEDSATVRLSALPVLKELMKSCRVCVGGVVKDEHCEVSLRKLEGADGSFPEGGFFLWHDEAQKLESLQALKPDFVVTNSMRLLCGLYGHIQQGLYTEADIRGTKLSGSSSLEDFFATR